MEEKLEKIKAKLLDAAPNEAIDVFRIITAKTEKELKGILKEISKK